MDFKNPDCNPTDGHQWSVSLAEQVFTAGSDSPGGETLFGADHPAGVDQGSSTEMVALPAHREAPGQGQGQVQGQVTDIRSQTV